MSEKTLLTDQELLDMIRHGKQSALIRLHKQCYDGIRNHILRNNGSEIDVDDVIQDALVITWQKAIKPDFVLSAKLSTYVHSVAKFIWMNKMRKEGKLSDPEIEPDMQRAHQEMRKVYRIWGLEDTKRRRRVFPHK